MEMQLYKKDGFAYFWDRNIRLWTCYPIDNEGNRIEWDENENPIECEYFPNKNRLDYFLNNKK